MHKGTGTDQQSTQVERPFDLSAIWRRLSVRLILWLGLLMFLAIVGIDSLRQAAAADLSRPADWVPLDIEFFSFDTNPSAASETVNADLTGSYLDYDAEIADHLRRSHLVGPQLTRSRLTHAHLFTRSLQ